MARQRAVSTARLSMSVHSNEVVVLLKAEVPLGEGVTSRTTAALATESEPTQGPLHSASQYHPCAPGMRTRRLPNRGPCVTAVEPQVSVSGPYAGSSPGPRSG